MLLSKIEDVVVNKIKMKIEWQIIKAKYSHLITFSCLAYGLNFLAIYLLSANTMKTTLTNYKATVKTFNNHNVANQNLKKVWKEAGGKAALLQPAETRRGSATKCFESLLCTKNCL